MTIRYTVSRTAIVCEVYEIEAENKADLEDKLEGCGMGDPVHTEWLDWHDGWTIDEEENLDPLYQMVKQHTPKETT
jgi:hypothetical protein